METVNLTDSQKKARRGRNIALGAVLLDAGRAAEAEQVYREDLRRNPDNGWSLFGLAQSLEAQGRAAEAAEARRGFAAAWRNADVELTTSRL